MEERSSPVDFAPSEPSDSAPQHQNRSALWEPALGDDHSLPPSTLEFTHHPHSQGPPGTVMRQTQHGNGHVDEGEDHMLRGGSNEQEAMAAAAAAAATTSSYAGMDPSAEFTLKLQQKVSDPLMHSPCVLGFEGSCTWQSPRGEGGSGLTRCVCMRPRRSGARQTSYRGYTQSLKQRRPILSSWSAGCVSACQATRCR